MSNLKDTLSHNDCSSVCPPKSQKFSLIPPISTLPIFKPTVVVTLLGWIPA